MNSIQKAIGVVCLLCDASVLFIPSAGMKLSDNYAVYAVTAIIVLTAAAAFLLVMFRDRDKKIN